MQIIVDGYNFLRCTPLAPAERQGLEQGRDAACNWLAALRRARGHDITIVFDGDLSTAPPLPGHAGGVHVEFAPSADAAIAAKARSGLLVVTSDRAVQRAVERAGAVACNSEVFWRHAEPLIAGAAVPGDADEQAAAEGGEPAPDLDIGDDWTKALDDPRLWALAADDAGAADRTKGGQRQTKRGRRLSRRESRLRSMLERL